jgi:dTDP-4-amino-4,6-dideoxygalactose transaminase
MIPVTKTFLPPLNEYQGLLQEIWQRGWLTNEGPLVVELENVLKDFLGVKHLLFVSNGTLALQLAIRSLSLHGDVLTTPFSYVATTNSILWENCRPVFVDIDPHTWCVNPALLESAVTRSTQAILATHVFGIPSAVEAIEDIARRHNLKVIYDAAHAFGVDYNKRSVLNYGDVSTLSFHATKLFHTAEGGAVVTNNDYLAKKLAHLRNFGHEGANQFVGLGINAKNSEIHAALGLSILPYVPRIIERRREITALYDRLIEPLGLVRPQVPRSASSNYSYYPVLMHSEAQVLLVVEALNKADIYPRRYFYPALTELPHITTTASCPVAQDVASRILCLPLYYELANKEVEQIVHTISLHICV